MGMGRLINDIAQPTHGSCGSVFCRNIRDCISHELGHQVSSTTVMDSTLHFSDPIQLASQWVADHIPPAHLSQWVAHHIFCDQADCNAHKTHSPCVALYPIQSTAALLYCPCTVCWVSLI
jgi:hypothetical protein